MRPLVLHIHERPLTVVKFNRDGDLVLTAAKDSKVNVVDAQNGELRGHIAHGGAVFGVDISVDSNFVASVSADGSMKIVRLADGACIVDHNLGGICKDVCFAADTSDGFLKVTVASDSFGARVPASITVIAVPLNVALSEPTVPDNLLERRLHITEGLQGGNKATRVLYGPFDQTLFSIHEEGTITVWSAVTGERLSITDAHTTAVTCLAWSRDMTILATASKDTTCKLWDVSGIVACAAGLTQSEAPKLTMLRMFKSERPLNGCSIHPHFRGGSMDTKRFPHVIMGGGQEARDVTTTGAAKGQFEAVVFNSVTTEFVGEIKGHFGPINTVCFAPDGKGFATGGEEGVVRINRFDGDYASLAQ